MLLAVSNLYEANVNERYILYIIIVTLHTRITGILYHYNIIVNVQVHVPVNILSSSIPWHKRSMAKSPHAVGYFQWKSYMHGDCKMEPAQQNPFPELQLWFLMDYLWVASAGLCGGDLTCIPTT